jgi:hypothetical protein
MLGFIIGLLVGAFLGVALMCILSVAGQSEINCKEDEPNGTNENNSKSL